MVKRVCVAIIACALMMGVLTSVCYASAAADLKQCKAYLQQHEFGKACAGLQYLLAEDSTLPKEQVKAMLMDAHLANGEVELGMSEFQNLLWEYPAYGSELHHILGRRLQREGKFEEAIAELILALQLNTLPVDNDDVKDMHRRLLVAYLGKDDYVSAYSQLDVILNLYSDEASTFIVGEGPRWKSQLLGAITELRLTAQSLGKDDPKSKALRYEYAKCMTVNKDWQEAVAVLKSLIRDYPDAALVWKLDLIKIYLDSKQYELAIPLCMEIISSDSGAVSDALVELAMAMTPLDRGQEALAIQNDYFAKHPELIKQAEWVRSQTATTGDKDSVQAMTAMSVEKPQAERMFNGDPCTALTATYPLSTIFWNMGSATETQMRADAANLRTQYDSNAEEMIDFEGYYIPASSNSKLAVFSDDGCDVYVNNEVTMPERNGDPQHLQTFGDSLNIVNHSWAAGQAYKIKICYSNIIYTGAGDIDGCTLYSYADGGQVYPLTTPTVTNVTSTTASDIYSTGDTVNVTVTFDLPVIKLSKPVLLTLKTGTGNAKASCDSATNPTTTLSFSYTFAYGDNNYDLEYDGTHPIPSGYITDLGGNALSPLFPTPGRLGSLSANKNIVVYTTNSPQSIYFVKPGGDNTKDGSDWDNALATPAAACNFAFPGEDIWVAEGTYYGPCKLWPGSGLYGGFDVGDTSFDDRDPASNVTVLNGDGAATCVVWVPYDSGSATIDGFTIQGGGSGVFLNGAATLSNNTITGNHGGLDLYYTEGGGGVICWSNSTITGNTITGNSSNADGGGIITYGCYANITNNTISSNTAAATGGGISTFYSIPTVDGNTISNNTAGSYGGGMLLGYTYNGNTATICNNTISGNSAVLSGGGFSGFADGTSVVYSNSIHNNTASQGGGIDASYRTGTQYYNNLIYSNTATSSGGGVYIGALEAGPPYLVNNTICSNTAPSASQGGGIYSEGGNPVIANNIVSSNTSGIAGSSGTPTFTKNDFYSNNGYNYVYFTYHPTDISVNPSFTSGYHLSYGSGCINAGDSASMPDGYTDFYGGTRKNGVIDIGADEY